jgi:indole-3-glycerol phosphate synthase
LFRLETLIAGKQEEVRLKRLAAGPESRPRPPHQQLRDFYSALKKPGISIIAEMKRKSPSAGVLLKDLDPAGTARDYEMASASALSVLTDRDYFGGSDGDILKAKSGCRLPVLRKEFIIDEFQIHESRQLGADAILLIVRILSEPKLRRFLDVAGACGLACLVETRNRDEVEKAVQAGAKIIGVNNRDLDTLGVDLTTSLDLAERIPKDAVKVSESGIRSAGDVRMLREAGFDGLLIGEALMRAGEAGRMLEEMVNVR